MHKKNTTIKPGTGYPVCDESFAGEQHLSDANQIAITNGLEKW